MQRSMKLMGVGVMDLMQIHNLRDWKTHLPTLRQGVTFRGVNPREEGDILHVGPIEARDANGNILLVVEGGIARKVGDIRRPQVVASGLAASNR